MQAKPFKFRHINRFVGAFLFLTAAILAVLVALAAKSKRWFDPVTRYRVELPVGSREEGEGGGTIGIKPGSDVRVLGNQVGHVEHVDLCVGDDLVPIESFDEVDPGEIRIVAILAVKGEFSHFVGPDSIAVLKFDLGGLGSAFFDISRGTRSFAPVELESGEPRQLVFARERDAKEEVFEVVKRLEGEIIPAIRRFEETGAEATAFFKKLNDDNDSLQRSLASLEEGVADFNKVMEQAASGEGALGDMIRSDSEMRKEFNEFATTLNRSTQSLEKSIENLGGGIEELRSVGIGSFNEAAKDFPRTMANTNAAIDEMEAGARQFSEALREFEVLVEGVQKHWLIRKNVEDTVEEAATSRSAPPRESSSRESSPRSQKEQGSETREGILKRIFKKDE